MADAIRGEAEADTASAVAVLSDTSMTQVSATDQEMTVTDTVMSDGDISTTADSADSEEITQDRAAAAAPSIESEQIGSREESEEMGDAVMSDRDSAAAGSVDAEDRSDPTDEDEAKTESIEQTSSTSDTAPTELCLRDAVRKELEDSLLPEARRPDWTDSEKFLFLGQVTTQTDGYSNHTVVDWDLVKVPGRSEAEKHIMWLQMKAEHVARKRANDEQIIAWRNAGSRESSSKIPKKLPHLPREMIDKILGCLIDEPRVLEVYFNFSVAFPDAYDGRHRCPFQNRIAARSKYCNLDPEAKWTEQTDNILSASAAPLFVDKSTREQFLKQYQFVDENDEGSNPIAIRPSQDIIYFGLGTWFEGFDRYSDYYVDDSPFKAERIAIDIAWWKQAKLENEDGLNVRNYFCVDIFWRKFAGLKELIMVVGSEDRDTSHHFQKAYNSFHEITGKDKLKVWEKKAMREMKALWRKLNAVNEGKKDYDKLNEDEKEAFCCLEKGSRNSGWITKLTFRRLERSFDDGKLLHRYRCCTCKEEGESEYESASDISDSDEEEEEEESDAENSDEDSDWVDHDME